MESQSKDSSNVLFRYKGIFLPILAGAVLFFGLILLNWTELLFDFPIATRAVTGSAASTKDVAEAVDQVVSMLMTISIGLFVFFGFVVKYFFDKSVPVTAFAGALTYSFLVFEMIGINIGYYVRAEILLLTIEGQAAFDHLSIMIARQAMFVHLSFVTGVVASIHVVLVEKQKQAEMASLVNASQCSPHA